MNSRMLMGLAALLVVAAIVVGYLGITLGRSGPAPTAEAPEPSVTSPVAEAPAVAPDPAAVEPQEPRLDVVVLARSLPAYHTVGEADLQTEQLRLMPPGSFSHPDELLGRMIWRDIPQGTVLNESHFVSGGPIARMIRPGERALAIQFDQRMGAGGHLSPGDYVDALLFLNENETNTDQTMQVAIPALRVLSVGSELGLATTGEPVTPPAPAADDQAEPPASRNQPSSRPETAVLAIPEALLTRFALAAEVGSLRLAVRAAEEGRLAEFYRGDSALTEELNQQLFQFEKFALSQAERPQPGLVEASASPRVAQAAPSAQRQGPPPVTVIRGTVSSLETP